MIELCPGPLRGRMARRAIRWKTGFHMIGICCFVEVFQMTTGTLGRRGRKLPLYVALVARNVDVGPRQRELGSSVVIELRTIPRCHCMANAARCWKACGGVIRIARAVKILQVATHTIRGNRRELAVSVALCAGDSYVCSG
jgi:hypothetical protein